MRRNTVQIAMANEENLVWARFRSGIFFTITTKFYNNIIKSKMIDIYWFDWHECYTKLKDQVQVGVANSKLCSH